MIPVFDALAAAAVRPPRVAAFPNETALSVACQKRVRTVYRGEVLKVHGGGSQQAGQPDLIGCIGGRMFAIELKQPGKRPTAIQYKRLRAWQAAGACAGWATTEVEFDAVLAHLGDLAWENPQLARDTA